MKTCQHCQTEINPRAKNCQTCTAIMAEANKRGTYSFAMEAINAAKADGLTGSEVHEAARTASKLGASKRAEWWRNYQDELKARETARVRDLQTNGPRRFDSREDARIDIEVASTFDARNGNIYSDQNGIDG